MQRLFFINKYNLQNKAKSINQVKTKNLLIFFINYNFLQFTIAKINKAKIPPDKNHPQTALA